MKKIMTLATVVACFALFDAKAQNVNGIRFSDIRADYVELSQDRQIFSRKVHVIFEYGQKATRESEAYVKDVFQ